MYIQNIVKIYTKTGDDGTTGLQGNIRIPKSNPRIMAYGAIDEANAFLGIVLTNPLDLDIRDILIQIQNELFLAGADLSNPALDKKENRVSEPMVMKLEETIDKFEKELPSLTNFILPGGEISSSQIHYSRTIVRRAETYLVLLKEKEQINENCIKYLNRLSDLLFVLSRVINKRNGKQDIIWKI